MNLFEFMHGKYGYLIILLINYKFGYVDRKSDALDNLIKFKVESDNLLGKHIVDPHPIHRTDATRF